MLIPCVTKPVRYLRLEYLEGLGRGLVRFVEGKSNAEVMAKDMDDATLSMSFGSLDTLDWLIAN